LKGKSDTNTERLKILRFITEKFHREGFYKTSMDEIARELRMSKKTIYKFFPTKENLLEVICQKTISDLTNEVNEIVSEKGDVITKIVRIINMYSNFISDISERWISDLRIHYPLVVKNLEDFRKGNIYSKLLKLIETGKKEKLIENYPGPIIINNFIISIHSILHSDFVINNKFSLQEAIKYSFDMLFNGMLTKKGKESYNHQSKMYKNKNL